MVEKFRIEGLRELDEALKELPKATARNVLLRTLKNVGEPMAKDAARLAPDDPATGGKDLKNSIRVLSVPAKERENHVEVAIGPTTKAFWGLFQEFGTAHHGPQPFMRPAFDGGAMRALNSIKKTLANEISKAVQRLARKAQREAAKLK
jgi:HK97 gp10 family phage protein